jgi:hypothetical protein
MTQMEKVVVGVDWGFLFVFCNILSDSNTSSLAVLCKCVIIKKCCFTFFFKYCTSSSLPHTNDPPLIFDPSPTDHISPHGAAYYLPDLWLEQSLEYRNTARNVIFSPSSAKTTSKRHTIHLPLTIASQSGIKPGNWFWCGVVHREGLHLLSQTKLLDHVFGGISFTLFRNLPSSSW